MKTYNKDIFVEKLRTVNFPNYENFQDANSAYSDFLSKLTDVINEVAPFKQSNVKNRSQEWFDGEVAEKISTRDKLYKKFKKSRLHVDELCFKEARNIAENLIKKKKKELFGNKINDNIKNPKELWKVLNDIGLPKKGSSGTQNICLKDNDEYVFDSTSTANIFKNSFSDIAKNLLDKLPIAPNRFNKETISAYYKSLNLKNKFRFSLVSVDTVHKILTNFNITKSTGNDGISGVFLKDGAEVLATPISQLCNLSILTSSFPDNCKTAKLLPLYKKGCKTDPQNYRSISLLPLISKVIEKVVHNQTQTFLDENNILYNSQSGFRKKYSTDSCLALLTDKVAKGFDSGVYTGMILIDLQKVFDTIDHEILLEKMSFVGFSKQVIDWFRSYLSNRTFLR